MHFVVFFILEPTFLYICWFILCTLTQEYDNRLAYKPGAYTAIPGTVCFGYNVQTASVVERNNSGTELVETGNISSNIQLELGCEQVIAQWDKMQDVKETIGVPFLMDVPILKYIFSTEVVSKEKTKVYLTIKAEVLDTGHPVHLQTGSLKQITTSRKGNVK